METVELNEEQQKELNGVCDSVDGLRETILMVAQNVGEHKRLMWDVAEGLAGGRKIARVDKVDGKRRIVLREEVEED